MESKFKIFNELGISGIQYSDGNLVASHLKGTYSLLKEWGASELICDAGLFHAIYGTNAFDADGELMISLTLRDKVSAVIGSDVENLVYLYCAADRGYTYDSIAKGDMSFKDRLRDEVSKLSDIQARNFIEITVANEMELVIGSEKFKKEHGKRLYFLFEGLKPYMSRSAQLAYQSELQEFSKSQSR